jgi:hypothetical protein
MNTKNMNGIYFFSLFMSYGSLQAAQLVRGIPENWLESQLSLWRTKQLMRGRTCLPWALSDGPFPGYTSRPDALETHVETCLRENVDLKIARLLSASFLDEDGAHLLKWYEAAANRWLSCHPSLTERELYDARVHACWASALAWLREEENELLDAINADLDSGLTPTDPKRLSSVFSELFDVSGAILLMERLPRPPTAVCDDLTYGARQSVYWRLRTSSRVPVIDAKYDQRPCRSRSISGSGAPLFPQPNLSHNPTTTAEGSMARAAYREFMANLVQAFPVRGDNLMGSADDKESE